MAARKVDGVIEAVRYAPDGSILMVRAYERRGVVWSDRQLLDRKGLLLRLKKGNCIVTGERKTYIGSVFETGPAVRMVDDHIVTDDLTATRDLLSGVGIF
jgi:hypothetical protein